MNQNKSTSKDSKCIKGNTNYTVNACRRTQQASRKPPCNVDVLLAATVPPQGFNRPAYRPAFLLFLTFTDILIAGIGILREEILPPFEDLTGKVVTFQLKLCRNRGKEEGTESSTYRVVHISDNM